MAGAPQYKTMRGFLTLRPQCAGDWLVIDPQGRAIGRIVMDIESGNHFAITGPAPDFEGKFVTSRSCSDIVTAVNHIAMFSVVRN